MCASNSHSYTHLILALGIVREPTVWVFSTSKYPGIHDIGPASKTAARPVSAAGAREVQARGATRQLLLLLYPPRMWNTAGGSSVHCSTPLGWQVKLEAPQ